MKRLICAIFAISICVLSVSCTESVKDVIDFVLPAPVLSEQTSVVTKNSIMLRWTADENAAEGYRCFYESGSGKSDPVSVYPEGSVCSLNLTGLAPATAYSISVYAEGYEIESGASRIIYWQSDKSSITLRTKAEDSGDSGDEGGSGSGSGSGSGTGEGGGGSQTSGRACRGWFELPAQKDDNRDGIDDDNPDFYYSWTMRADAPKIRNFSSCYSKDRIHPYWVAAPMHNCYTGGSGRNDSYQNDPAIKCVQSYKYPGYTRGHMVGSSDRTVSVPTNRQAFYYSNIGCQIQTGFNTGGGAWNLLEELVDTQWNSCSDTLYQVIGCIFEDFTDRYGSKITKRTATNGAGDTYQFPTAWYKVLLRTKSGNTGKRVDQCSADELKCCAFILAHKSNQKHYPSEKDIYSVEYVEQLTGLEFFVNVPNAPKGVVNAKEWL